MSDTPPGHIALLSANMSDRDRAKDYRTRLGAILDQAIELINEANANGLHIGFSLARDQMGRNRVQEIQIFRPL
jgi:hypothetical protein